MNMLEQAETVCFSESVRSIIKNTCIVDFGTILAVVDKGVVKVGVSVAKNKDDIRIITCTLVSPVSQAFSFYIEPQVKDKVLVIYPKAFKEAMFSLSQEDVILDESAIGYSPLGAVAILCNQFRPNDYKNSVSVNENGVITFSVEDNSVTLDLTENGKISLSDSNGCTYETSSESTIINGKLEIKK